jgi:hypothetical protein
MGITAKALFLSIVLWASLFVVASGAGTCKMLLTGTAAVDERIMLQNPCARIVNYEYYLPNSTTDEQLAAQVKGALTNELLQMPTSCRASVIALVCTTAYLGCKADIDLENPQTYNFAIYTGVVPRPIPIPVIK